MAAGLFAVTTMCVLTPGNALPDAFRSFRVADPLVVAGAFLALRKAWGAPIPARLGVVARCALCALCLFASALTTCQMILSRQGSLDALLQSRSHIAVTLLYIGGLFVTLLTVAKLLTDWFLADEKPATDGAYSRMYAAFARRPLLTAWLAIAACWLPMLLMKYPGAVFVDAGMQIERFFGLREWTIYTVPLSTVLIGVPIQIGKWLGSDNLGLFLSVLTQYAALSFSLAYAISRMTAMRAPRALVAIALATACLSLFFQEYATTLIKDVPFTAAFVVYVTTLSEWSSDPERFGKRRCALLGASAFLVLTLRLNGVIAVAVASGATLLYTLRKRNRHKPACGRAVRVALIAPVALWLLLQQVIFPAMGLARFSGAGEALGVFAQQTARCARVYAAETPPDEIEAIDRVYPYDRLAERYRPDRTDEVRVILRKDATLQDIAGYLRVWARQTLRWPKESLTAALLIVENYLSLNVMPDVSYNGLMDKFDDRALSLSYPEALQGARDLLDRIVEPLYQAPILNFQYVVGAYSQITLLALVVALSLRGRRFRGAVALLPSVALLVSLLFSAYYSVRYILPLIAAFPVTVASVRRAALDDGAATPDSPIDIPPPS